jgi:hypothetical protein
MKEGDYSSMLSSDNNELDGGVYLRPGGKFVARNEETPQSMVDKDPKKASLLVTIGGVSARRRKGKCWLEKMIHSQ